MNEWKEQQSANILALLTASRYAKRKEVLEKLCRALSQTTITWALSMSAALFFEGVWDDFNDLDILVDINNVKEFESTFTQLGGEIDHQTRQKEAFTSPYYKEGILDGVHFDLIGDITIDTYNTRYRYSLKRDDIEFLYLEKNVAIPVCPVEVNYLLYAMMEGWQARRRLKRRMCGRYLSDGNVRHPEILHTAQEGEVFKTPSGSTYTRYLPQWISEKIKALLDGTYK